jgi:hypothetical protein
MPLARSDMTVNTFPETLFNRLNNNINKTALLNRSSETVFDIIN